MWSLFQFIENATTRTFTKEVKVVSRLDCLINLGTTENGILFEFFRILLIGSSSSSVGKSNDT